MEVGGFDLLTRRAFLISQQATASPLLSSAGRFVLAAFSGIHNPLAIFRTTTLTMALTLMSELVLLAISIIVGFISLISTTDLIARIRVG